MVSFFNSPGCVTENLIISHWVAPLAAAIGGVVQEWVKERFQKIASNASVATNTPNHPFPPKRRWVVFCLLRHSPNPQKHRINPAATRFCKSLYASAYRCSASFSFSASVISIFKIRATLAFEVCNSRIFSWAFL